MRRAFSFAIEVLLAFAILAYNPRSCFIYFTSRLKGG